MIKPNPEKILLIAKNHSHYRLAEKIASRSSLELLIAENASDSLAVINKNYPMIVLLSEIPGLPPDVFARRLHWNYPSTDIIGFELKAQVGGLLFNILPDEEEGMIESRINKVIGDRRALDKCGMVGRSFAIRGVANSILSAAPTDLTVLFTGPSGVGKELGARAIHENSKRAGKEFISINCGALTEGVLSSELFGHEKGAFTGAAAQKVGLFESVGQGTLFLDEIGEVSADTQVKLLRVLEDGSFYRVGGNRMLKSKARVVAATNRDLFADVSNGLFRQDLYYRLRVIEITILPLRDRPEDIPILAENFIFMLGEDYRKVMEPGTAEAIMRYDWPGNGRELRNFVESRIALSTEGKITRDDVEIYVRDSGYQRRNLPVSTGLTPKEAEHKLIIQAIMALKDEISGLKRLITENLPGNHEISDTGRDAAAWSSESGRVFDDRELKSVSEAEKEAIASALKRFHGNRRKTARSLGIGERTLYRKIAKYNLLSVQ